MCGGGGYRPPPVMEPPKRTDPEVEEALRKERELALRRRGRQSTILTSGGFSNQGAQKTLLGG